MSWTENSVSWETTGEIKSANSIGPGAYRMAPIAQRAATDGKGDQTGLLRHSHGAADPSGPPLPCGFRVSHG